MEIMVKILSKGKGQLKQEKRRMISYFWQFRYKQIWAPISYVIC